MSESHPERDEHRSLKAAPRIPEEQLSGELERARNRLKILNEIGKLLTRFEGFEKTIRQVIANLTRALSLRSVIFMLDDENHRAPILWQADCQTSRGMWAAKAHMSNAYAFLVRHGALAAEGQRRSRDFIVLPLAISRGPIFGALQLEGVEGFDEQDLVFANAAVNQMAIALDRSATLEVAQAAAEDRKAAADDRAAMAMLREADARSAVVAGEALNASLEHLVAERTAEAEARSRELERSNAELLQFAHVTSHDLKEPLRAVMVFVQLLEEACAGKLEEDGAQLLSSIGGGVRRMSALIDALLAYSQVGQAGGTFGQVDCDAVLTDCLRNLQNAVEESGAVVTREPLPVVTGNKALLTQLFQNLLENALKFRGERPPAVHVSATIREGGWVFAFRDNGIGVALNHADRIFQIFRRLHPSSRYPGTGIGLAICKKVVEEHHGRIWLESTPSGGATFLFTLSAPHGAEDAGSSPGEGPGCPR